MITDPISDMLTQIRNAQAVKKTEVVLPYSKFKHALADLLKKSGWLGGAEQAEDGKFKMLKLKLKYDNSGMPVISGLRRISKPGQRMYSAVTRIPRVMLGNGATIVSTSRGLMTADQARKEKLGGELICEIW
jgi:small subunit ribosomal protein S8